MIHRGGSVVGVKRSSMVIFFKALHHANDSSTAIHSSRSRTSKYDNEYTRSIRHGYNV